MKYYYCSWAFAHRNVSGSCGHRYARKKKTEKTNREKQTKKIYVYGKKLLFSRLFNSIPWTVDCEMASRLQLTRNERQIRFTLPRWTNEFNWEEEKKDKTKNENARNKLKWKEWLGAERCNESENENSKRNKNHFCKSINMHVYFTLSLLSNPLRKFTDFHVVTQNLWRFFFFPSIHIFLLNAQNDQILTFTFPNTNEYLSHEWIWLKSDLSAVNVKVRLWLMIFYVWYEKWNERVFIHSND